MVLEKWYSHYQINELIKFSDILIIALPLNKDTRFIISKEELINLGESSYLINISRGDLICESDLFYVLKNNLIKSAVIDVCSIEPLSRWSKLWKLENLVITPHISGNINNFVEKVQNDFLEKTKLKINC